MVNMTGKVNNMAFFNEFPHTRTYDSDLGWLIGTVKKLIDRIENYNEVHFADPVTWSINTQYETATIVRDSDSGDLYISKQPVPAGILLSNSEYWEILGTGAGIESCRIINVADYGALGVAGADYTTQIQEALNAGNIIYFPAGEYAFGTVYTSEPKYIFGDGSATIWKPLHRITTSNQYKTMLQSSGNLVIDSIKIVGDNSITTQTGAQFYQSSIIQQYGGSFRFTNCIFEKIYDTYHLSQGDLEFYDRNGLLLYVSDADRAEIDHCTFLEYGGEELIWISRAVARFGDAVPILVHDNIFKNRTMLDNGGVIDGGSAVNILGGNIIFNNNMINNYYERGSFVNLLGARTEVYSNICTNSDMASFIDCCEGYYAKSEVVSICDNYFEDKNGVCSNVFKAQAQKVIVKNNHMEGLTLIHTYQLSDTSLVSYQVYKPSGVAWADYDEVAIENNEMIVTQDSSAPTASPAIYLSQSNSAVGSRAVLQRLSFLNNRITYADGLSAFVHQIFNLCRIVKAEIRSNSFPRGGTTAPSSSRNVNISYYTEPSVAGDTIFLSDNIFDNSAVNTAAQIVIGGANAAANLNIIATGNAIKTTAVVNVIAGSAFTNTEGDYNYNFSALTG